MTTLPTTSDASGLPDIGGLTLLANQLFNALPGVSLGQEAAPAAPSKPAVFGAPPLPSAPTFAQANLLPPATSLASPSLTPPMTVSLPAAAAYLAPPTLITPRVLPTQAQSADAPAFASTTAPVLGRANGPALGVPEAYAANAPAAPLLPTVTDAALPASSGDVSSIGAGSAPPSVPNSGPSGSPFYFIGEESRYSNTSPTSSLLSSATAPAASNAVAPSVPAAPPLPPGLGDAALPLVGKPVSLPSTPYYFVGESSSYPAALPKGAEKDSLKNSFAAQPLALHGDHALGSARPAANGPAPATPEKSASMPSFYFNESATAPHSSEPPRIPAGRGAFDVQAVRRDFPILREPVNGRPLVWFDNAATTQKPQAVIDRLAHFYAHENSNIHRAAHELAARATDAYEAARQKVARFMGASSVEEIIFVRGATEGVNLVAQAWGKHNILAGDEIIVSHLEHHANIVPWQMLAAEKGAKLRVIPVDNTGQVRLDEYQKLLNDRTKIVAVTQVSNALGTIVPVKDIIELGHRAGAKVLIDGAQSVSHLRVNVRALDADFFVFSGHKIFGPTGIGVVYGKREILEHMQPYQGGGNMIADVTFEQTQYNGPPARFEAGTGNIADAVGLGAALDYVDRIGLENIARYEHDLLVYGLAELKTVPGLHLIGTAAERTSVMSFVLDGFSNDEVGKALNEEGIAVRTGHHCAQPILRRFGQESTVRPSIAFYNTYEEIDLMVSTLKRLVASRRGGL
jgi:cysteine desulfurase/selenocysteine lyase